MPGTRRPEYANDFNKADLLQVLLALQGKVNRELHVATLCVIDSQVNAYTFRGLCFPKMPDRDAAAINVICIKASDIEILQTAVENHEQRICVALMTDLDSQANYEHIKTKKQYEAITNNSQLHSLNNAVLVYIGDPIVQQEDEEEQQ